MITIYLLLVFQTMPNLSARGNQFDLNGKRFEASYQINRYEDHIWLIIKGKETISEVMKLERVIEHELDLMYIYSRGNELTVFIFKQEYILMNRGSMTIKYYYDWQVERLN